MKTTHLLLAASLTLMASLSAGAQTTHNNMAQDMAQDDGSQFDVSPGDEIPQRLSTLVPESSGFSARDLGVRSHTQMQILVVPNSAVATTAPQINTPAKIRKAYALPARGGSNAIAIVDAYDYPTALADFNAFSQQFGLPRETSKVPTASNKTFQVVYAPGSKPISGGNYIASWNMEEALDIEWAHAMAPSAKIYLVEAASDSTPDLLAAVRVASNLPGVKEVSMSWGASESADEAWNLDPSFTTPGIVYFASGGDAGAVMEYPAASPNVVSCGGTSIVRNTRGAVMNETGWNDTGCGLSMYEPRPAFQNGVANVVGNSRGVSDMSFDADPNTGVYVYDTTPVWGEKGWWILGGTSVSAPALAGIVNTAGTVNGFAANTASEEARIYGSLGNAKAFHDVTTGTAGYLSCHAGYDFLTGVGSPRGLVGK